MNQIVAQQPQLQVPAHLAQFYSQPAASSLGAAMAAGISSMAHNKISIRQSRWRMVNTQGEETVAQTFHLDVLIVDANPAISKTFYEGAYNPNEESNQAPRCFSDNGIAPSDRVAAPCAYTCAACPNNAFGSKITANGKKAKACADSRRVAVILADNPDGLVYELRVPAASLTNMGNAMSDMVKRGVAVETMVWRLEFDPAADHPKITFTPAAWANEVQFAAVQRLMGTKEVEDVVNKNDRPIDTGRQLVAPAQPATPVPQAAAPTAAPNYAQPAPVQQAPLPQPLPPQVPQQLAPQPMAMAPVAPVAQPAMQQFASVASAPASPSPLGLNLPPLPAQAQQVPIQVQSMNAAEQPKRKRRTKAEIEAAQAAQVQQAMATQPQVAQAPVPMAMPAFQAQLAPVGQAAPISASPSNGLQLPPIQAYAPPPAAANMDQPHTIPAAAAVPVNPTPTSPALDGLLANLPL